MMPSRSLLLCLFVAFSAAGCVTSSTHQSALDTVASLEDQLTHEQSSRESVEAELADTRARLDDTRARLAEEQARAVQTAEALAQAQAAIAQAQSTLDALAAQLKQDAAAQSQLSDELSDIRRERERLSAMLDARGQENEQLVQRLRVLQEVEREVRERDRIQKELMSRLQALIDAGQLEVSVVRGRLVLHLSQEVLFDSGKAELKPEGSETLRAIAATLVGLDDRTFQVEGHTDNVPIRNQKFPSNWELSNARAVSVVHLLVSAGVSPEHLSAAGYSEFHPVASNDAPEGRQKNRRIEIVMLPNLDVIADVAFQSAP